MKSKYDCEKGSFQTKFLSHWNEHTEWKKHKGEKREVTELKCNFCDYETDKTTDMKQHYFNNHAIKDERQKEFKFYCEKCDFGCFIQLLFVRHLETLKHNTNNSFSL